MPSIQQVAEAFSRHQFTDAYAHLAADVRWFSVGESILEGRDTVIEACEQSSTDLAQVRTEFVRFRSIVGTDAVAVDTVGRYIDSDEQISAVFILRHLRIRRRQAHHDHLIRCRTRAHVAVTSHNR